MSVIVKSIVSAPPSSNYADWSTAELDCLIQPIQSLELGWTWPVVPPSALQQIYLSWTRRITVG